MSIIRQIQEKYGLASDVDTYKMSHSVQYVPGATRLMSYIESRGGKFDEVVFFGLQLILKEYFERPITLDQAHNLIEFQRQHLGMEIPGFEESILTVVNEYDGKLPIRIRAVPEGTVVPTKNVLVTIETTVDDPRVFSLVSYFETKLMRMWSPTTVATMSREIKKVILSSLRTSAEDPDGEIGFKLHDFGSRGVSSMETAAFAGAGHLVNFCGSDTSVAIMAMEFAYSEPMAGFSIPATEHSTTTSHGRGNEINIIEQMFDNFAKPGAIFSTVADSYDIMNFVDNIAPQFKARLAQSGATWVIRPDSGDSVQMPVEIVRRLGKTFGYTWNNKGFKVLNNVRVIQGDGIDIEDVKQILHILEGEMWSASNIVFGMGGGLLQKNNRDTQKFAQKACAILVNGVWQDVYKDPANYDPITWEKIEGSSFKTSKAGRLTLVKNDNGEFLTLREEEAVNLGLSSLLEDVYINGEIVRDMTLAEVRKNAMII